MKEILYGLDDLSKKLNTSNSSKEKERILGDYIHLKEILGYIYDPMRQFNVTSKTIKKMKNKLNLCDNDEIYAGKDIVHLLENLIQRKVTGHAAIASVICFINHYPEYEELVYKIIDKDLKCRIGAKLINKVMPNTIFIFETALAKKYEDHEKQVDFEKDKWLISRKLDGIRCICIKQKNNIKFYTRNGKDINTLDKLKPEILKLDGDFVLDGELCIVDENGNEDFKKIVSEFRKKDHTIKHPKYLVFDLLTIEDFYNKKSKLEFSQRLTDLMTIFPKKSTFIEIVEFDIISKEDDFLKWKERAAKNGWEGTMIRKDVVYEGKRTKNLLKVKTFIDDEFIIQSVEFGNIRYIDESGNDIEEEMLASVKINYKGFIVGVGSGWSIDQRRYYYKHPKALIGKQITVKYFGESSNKDGELSLRFPTLKMLYEDERDF